MGGKRAAGWLGEGNGAGSGGASERKGVTSLVSKPCRSGRKKQGTANFSLCCTHLIHIVRSVNRQSDCAWHKHLH